MKTRNWIPLMLLCACAAGPAAGGEFGDTSDTDATGDETSKPDMGLPSSCEDWPALELGRCVLAGTDLDCTGQGDEELEFTPLLDGDSMRVILGPQGSLMLVFLARGSGFDPGDVEMVASPDNPLVEMWLTDKETDEEIARYRGYVAFTQEGPDAPLVSASAMFAITELGAAQLAEHSIVVEALLRDKDDQLRCGQTEIVVLD